MSNLKLLYYYDYGVYITMHFLSWAGRPLYQYMSLENEEYVLKEATSALKALHDLQVLHKDAEPRNML
jgi:serine/threonine protein kinase